MGTPLFTVFTPAYNPGELIARTYRSLCAQTLRDFEWLVVDDGSSDGTRERVRNWQAEAAFPIRYFFQENGGKHRAHNRAVREASGDLFAVLDSDDAIMPRALERLLFHWLSIPPAERGRFSGVGCLCVDSCSRTVGRPLPHSVLDCRHYEIDARFGAVGEKWGFHRTSVLREFPFPEITGERFCPDAVVWNRIATRYLVRHVNEALRIYHSGRDGITANHSALMAHSPHGARLYYKLYLELPVPIWWKARRAVNYVRFSLHGGVPAKKILSDSPVALLSAAGTPPAVALYAWDRLRFRVAHPRSLHTGVTETA